MNAINSPFRYPGGKFYARKLILSRLFPHNSYIEPFAGGASIFFAKTKVKDNWLNDADSDLINCYHHIRDHVDSLITFLDGLPATKELHHYYKNQFTPQNDLERAGRWYYLNRTSYSGIMNRQNCYWGYGDKFSMRPENWARHLQRCSEKLQTVKITNQDFETVIETAPDGSFLFIDPPYFNADQDKFYTCSFSTDDHYRLQAVLQKHAHRIKFLLTYDNSSEIYALYDWVSAIETQEWNYTINRTDDQKEKSSTKGKRYRGQELFITNYQSDKSSIHAPAMVQLPLWE
ncbi:MAG: DNA adenine methylase [bacterium]|nr:DNA adenine methylase [bacterium]